MKIYAQFNDKLRKKTLLTLCVETNQEKDNRLTANLIVNNNVIINYLWIKNKETRIIKQSRKKYTPEQRGHASDTFTWKGRENLCIIQSLRSSL